MAAFSIYPRKKKNGKAIYYVRFKNPDGTYSTAHSTQCTTRRDAEKWAEAELEKKKIYIPGADVLFKNFSAGFFDWNSTWAVNKRVEGRRISLSHCNDRTDKLKRFLLPVFGDLPLSAIDKLKIRDFRNDLFSKGYSGSLINKCLYALKAILEAAEDAELIKSIPKITKAAENEKEKGILSIEEVGQLFRSPWESLPSYSHPAKEQYFGFIGNILSCITGIRLGELQALQIQDINIDRGYIIIRRSWDRKIKALTATTKSGKERNILIPSRIVYELRKIIDKNPYGKPESFIFYSIIEDQPIDAKVFIKSLYLALSKIGIDEAERKKRNITFHSWRHWFNSLLINEKIPLQKVQEVIGHTDRMSKHYYHLNDMQDIGQIQENIISLFPQPEGREIH